MVHSLLCTVSYWVFVLGMSCYLWCSGSKVHSLSLSCGEWGGSLESNWSPPTPNQQTSLGLS